MPSSPFHEYLLLQQYGKYLEGYLQSTQLKTRQNILLFFLPQTGIEPWTFSPDSSALPYEPRLKLIILFTYILAVSTISDTFGASLYQQNSHNFERTLFYQKNMKKKFNKFLALLAGKNSDDFFQGIFIGAQL